VKNKSLLDGKKVETLARKGTRGLKGPSVFAPHKKACETNLAAPTMKRVLARNSVDHSWGERRGEPDEIGRVLGPF